MMELLHVFLLTQASDDAVIANISMRDKWGMEDRVDYAYRADDTSEMASLITQWITDNNPEVLPYVPPVPLATEELRERMPDKTPREFRDTLTRMGIMPPEVTTKINEIPFDIERQYALNAWEVMTTATRIDPYIDMIGAMFGKSAEDIDTAWVE